LKLRYLKSYGNYDSDNSDESEDNVSESPPPEKKVKTEQVEKVEIKLVEK
jgi:hypothetical protein